MISLKSDINLSAISFEIFKAYNINISSTYLQIRVVENVLFESA